LQPDDANLILALAPFTPEQAKPTLAAGAALLLVSQPVSMNITGAVENGFLTYTVSGSGVNADLARERLNVKDLLVRNDSLYAAVVQNPDEPDIEVQNAYLENVKAISARGLEYAKLHPDSELSGYFVVMGADFDDFEARYGVLDDNVKNGMFADIFNQNLQTIRDRREKEANRKIKPGLVAPGFTLKNLADRDVSLNDLKGKYLLLDFWGSWCSWCARDFPKMKEYYAKYRQKVEIVGIDCGDSDEVWRKAVKDRALEWTQLYNPQNADAPEKDLTQLYEVEGFPTKILIDPDGKIIHVFSGHSDELYIKLDEMFGE
jgi:thiol-disulfide isomerase/thioredoxin